MLLGLEQLRRRLNLNVRYMINVTDCDISKTRGETRVLRSARILIEFYQLACDVCEKCAGDSYTKDFKKYPWDIVCKWAVKTMDMQELDDIFAFYSERHGVVDSARIMHAGVYINGVRNTLVRSYGTTDGLVKMDISDSVYTITAVIYLQICRALELTPPIPYEEFCKRYYEVIRRCTR